MVPLCLIEPRSKLVILLQRNLKLIGASKAGRGEPKHVGISVKAMTHKKNLSSKT